MLRRLEKISESFHSLGDQTNEKKKKKTSRARARARVCHTMPTILPRLFANDEEDPTHLPMDDLPSSIKQHYWGVFTVWILFVYLPVLLPYPTKMSAPLAVFMFLLTAAGLAYWGLVIDPLHRAYEQSDEGRLKLTKNRSMRALRLARRAASLSAPLNNAALVGQEQRLIAADALLDDIISGRVDASRVPQRDWDEIIQMMDVVNVVPGAVAAVAAAQAAQNLTTDNSLPPPPPPNSDTNNEVRLEASQEMDDFDPQVAAKLFKTDKSD
jgi:hypothetical protein